jgi:signal transduction histidine kinase
MTDLVLQTEERRGVRAYGERSGNRKGTPMRTRMPRPADLVLALCCAAAAVGIHVTGIDSVPANRRPDAVSVALTLAALLPLAWRRRAPLPVLVACVPGFLGLIAGRYSVGAAPVGLIVGFYTVAAWDTRRRAQIGLAVAAAAYAFALALRPIDLSVEGAVVQAALLVGGWVLGAGVRERRELHGVREAESARQVTLERERAAHAATEERLRISRELHDILGHAFSVMVVQAGVAEHLIDISPADARRAVAEIRRTGRTSLAEMRGLLHVLREGDGGAPLPRDPAASLADLPALIATVGLPVDLRVTGEPGELSPGLELAAYRLIQEALTNTMKHAGASTVRVRLTHTADALVIEVSDDGGRPADRPAYEGHGLAGMRERVAMYGGELVTGRTTDGYRVAATFRTRQAVA